MPCGNPGVPTLLEGVGAASEWSTVSRRDDMACNRVCGMVCGFGAAMRFWRGGLSTRETRVALAELGS
jgi:hypothetical protein